MKRDYFQITKTKLKFNEMMLTITAARLSSNYFYISATCNEIIPPTVSTKSPEILISPLYIVLACHPRTCLCLEKLEITNPVNEQL